MENSRVGRLCMRMSPRLSSLPSSEVEMEGSDPRSWMWTEALDLVARAERMHRHMFRPQSSRGLRISCWEPPVDMFETEHEVIVMTTLPGVDPATITTSIDNGILEIFGRRSLPPELHSATIHRLELPQGLFERRLRVPPGAYREIRGVSMNGCLVVTLRKQKMSGEIG